MQCNSLQFNSTFSKFHNRLPSFSAIMMPVLVLFTTQVQLIAADPPPKQHEFEYALNEAGAIVARQSIPSHLVKAVIEAEEKIINSTDKFDHGALVFTVLSADGKMLHADAEIHHVGNSGGGFMPHRVIEDDPVIQVLRHGSPIELRVVAPGYRTFTRKTMIRRDQITVWDDIVLDPIPPGEGATIKGRVVLESGTSANDLPIRVDGTEVTTADADGRFQISDSRAGKVRVNTFKRGYCPIYTEVDVKDKGVATCELKGFRVRTAKFRWAYQPDGSRNFASGILGGEENLEAETTHRLRFGDGLKEVDKESDFMIYQKEDKLRIHNFDVRGPDGPGIIELKSSSLDSVKEAPSLGYKANDFLFQPGRVYLIRCYDGAHYAKIEVLSTDLAPLEDE
ncbi:MAG: hypothetical protein HY287_16430 [Planctomycetes bacterium]|nr:hypothetical protein [Planctomycetota bacterium]MBI3835913.1 hypothetical protein [Planctomycetota bacterium]